MFMLRKNLTNGKRIRLAQELHPKIFWNNADTPNRDERQHIGEACHRERRQGLHSSRRSKEAFITFAVGRRHAMTYSYKLPYRIYSQTSGGAI